ncbi:MAG: hypothetical protein ABIO16_14010, partial [Nocardioides sp.]
TGAVVTVSRAVVRSATDRAAAQAELQRTYAGADRAIRPESFRAPVMDSPRVRAAARAHGIDLDRWLDRRGL